MVERAREHELSRGLLPAIIVVEGNLDVAVAQVDDAPVAEGLVKHGVADVQRLELARGHGRARLRGLVALLGPALEPPGRAVPRGLAAVCAQFEVRAPSIEPLHDIGSTCAADDPQVPVTVALV